MLRELQLGNGDKLEASNNYLRWVSNPVVAFTLFMRAPLVSDYLKTISCNLALALMWMEDM